jgi:Holliday junction resolvase RusA-like endonuclease
MILAFTVEGKPVPWARTAAYHGRKLTTEKQRSYQRLVRALAARSRPRGWDLNARFAVEIVAHGTPKQRFDLDNVGKQILDSCNKVLWSDDRHVDVLAIVRRVERERPRVEVSVALLTVAERDGAKIDITIDNRPCTLEGAPAELRAPSRPQGAKQKPRGVGAPGARPKTAGGSRHG